MARGTQLLQLVTDLRAELGRSSSVAVGVDDLPSLKQTIRRTQETLYDEYDWPHLRTVFDRIPMQAGERFYDFPAELNFDKLEDVAVWYSGQPFEIERPIGFRDYAIYDSENNARCDPVLKWDIRWRGTKEQIEVWPIPASTNQVGLQFIGIRKLRPMVGDQDVADLDDQLIILYAAAELLARQKSADAPIKADLAKARFQRLKSNAGRGNKTYSMVGEGMPRKNPRVVVRVGR
jgi:hypothetical protein